MATQEQAPRAAQRSVGIRAFLIADLRGYTRFTDQRGDEAAARLTQRFAQLANEVLTGHEGQLLEVRGDEVLGVFVSPRDAVRAAVALQAALATETERDPDLPFRAGVGLDAGEASPVDGGYRGRALNMAARLCSRARPGEILVSPELAHLAGAVDGVVFEERGSVRLKGLSRPVRLQAVVALGQVEREEAPAVASGTVEFRVLGPLEVLAEGRSIALGGVRQRIVLAHLVLEASHVVSMDSLIERAWGAEAPSSARSTIQSSVSHLRSALGAERIESKAPGYVLHVEPDEVDLLKFERLLRRARRLLASDTRQAVVTFDDALSLWRGAPLADLDGVLSLASDVVRLDELRVAALEDRVAALIELGEHREVISELEALVARHPLRERLWANLMLALYRSGRQAEALDAFERARSKLAGDVGIHPSRELRELRERMLKQDPGLEPSGRALRSYRLLEEIGHGAFGVVWRAVDPGIGREVAIKQIQARSAEDPDFVRRFEREAQIVARLEHPHVVPLYDYWRDATGAYLVMRLMRAGSLADAIEQRRLDLDEVVRLLGHVADALSAAHRQGLVHRDIKPENILLDHEGNAYLSDFGIAEDEKEAAGVSGGSPDRRYRSPERERGEATPRSDIFALGVVLREMVADRTDLPAEARKVIDRATASSPSERYADAVAFADAFRRVSGTSDAAAQAAGRTDIRNPYKGLRPFSEADASDFFGRDAQVRRLVDRLKYARFLVVVGPSGSGKSSVVRAGLLPALRSGVLPGSEDWFYADMLPGPQPLEELEAALLRVAATPPASLLEELERDGQGLLQAARGVLPTPDAQMVLVVDQFEEVFTLTEDERLRSEFLELLATAASDPSSPLRIIATLRADHYDRPLSYPVMAELVRTHSEVVVPLSAEELERAIAGPAELVGVVPERALIAEMVADVTDQPGALPLMQFALTETFERRTDNVMTLEAYRETGGVTGALARRAEQLFIRLNETGREAARQLFLHLVSVGEGTEDTRRLVRRVELASLEVDAKAMDAVIDSFGRHRLLSFDRDPDTRGPTVEVAHESLLREWTRLRGWIDASREDVIVHRRLRSEAAEWEASSHDPSFLLRGSRLAQVEGWANATGLALSATERAYVGESVAARRAEEEAEAERLAHERALERRSVVRLRGLVAALTAAAVVATTLTVLAVSQRGRARREARTATARELAAAADANLFVDPERSLLLALQAIEATREDGTVLREAEQALHNAVEADRSMFTIRNPSTANVQYSPDGRLIASGGSAGGLAQDDVFLWDARTGAPVHRLQGHTGDVGSVVFNVDGSRLVTTADDDRTIVWDTESGAKLLEIHGRQGEAFGASFSPDGTRIAIGANAGSHARIVDAATGKELRTLQVPGAGGICGPEFSPDGSRVTAVACFTDDQRLLVWDAATGKVLLDLPDQGLSAVYDAAGTRILTQSGTVWDARTGRRLFSLGGFSGSILGTAWSADGTRIATGGSDGVARVWDAESGDQLFALAGHGGLVAMVDFNPDGTRLVTGGGDGTARVWDVTPGAGSEAFTVAQRQDINAVEYSEDGSKLLLTGWDSNGTWLLHPLTGRRVRSYPNLYGRGAFGPGATTVVGAGCFDDRCPTPAVLDLATGKRLRAVDAKDWRGFRTIAFGPGETVVTAEEDDTVKMWSVASGQLLRSFGSRSSIVEVAQEDLAFSPDGRLLAGIDTRAVVRVWRVSTGAEILTFRAHTGLAHAVAFSPDGGILATAAGDGAALWNASTGKRIRTLAGSGSVNDVAFSRDGTKLATAGEDGRAVVWDLASGRELMKLGTNPAGVASVAFSPDGARLAVAGSDGRLRVFLLRTVDLIRVARARVSRGFTEAECRQYLHVPACPSSLRSASRPPAVASAPPPRDGPEGAFRVSILPGDLPRGVFPNDDVSGIIGDYTLSLSHGTWQTNEVHPDFSGRTAGTYTVSGDRITFTDQFDAYCFGWTWTARWSADERSLTFIDTAPTAGSTCRAFPGPQGPAVLAALFDSHPWARVAHHSKGG